MTERARSAYFFGSSNRALFGIREFGSGDIVRDTGVVLCYPAPQEYRMAHWIFQKLATNLASHGYPVLRFDYYATGDSAGATTDGSLSRWVEDIATAESELRDSAGVRRVSLVGMRLGATLAFRAVAEGLNVKDLVLWDPVVDGATYLAAVEEAEVRTLNRSPYPVKTDRMPGELMGYPFSDAMRRDVTNINLLSEPIGTPRRLHIVSPVENAKDAALLARCEAEGVTASQSVVNDPVLYPADAYPVDTLLAHRGASAIVDFLGARRT